MLTSWQFASQILDELNGLNGSTGMLYLNEDGRIYRELPWAKFQNGVPSPILIPNRNVSDE